LQTALGAHRSTYQGQGWIFLTKYQEWSVERKGRAIGEGVYISHGSLTRFSIYLVDVED
jgi:hypothetical protein